MLSDLFQSSCKQKEGGGKCLEWHTTIHVWKTAPQRGSHYKYLACRSRIGYKACCPEYSYNSLPIPAGIKHTCHLVPCGSSGVKA